MARLFLSKGNLYRRQDLHVEEVQGIGSTDAEFLCHWTGNWKTPYEILENAEILGGLSAPDIPSGFQRQPGKKRKEIKRNGSNYWQLVQETFAFLMDKNVAKLINLKQNVVQD